MRTGGFVEHPFKDANLAVDVRKFAAVKEWKMMRLAFEMS